MFFTNAVNNEIYAMVLILLCLRYTMFSQSKTIVNAEDFFAFRTVNDLCSQDE